MLGRATQIYVLSMLVVGLTVGPVGLANAEDRATELKHPRAPVEILDLAERLTSSVPISGELVAGLMIDNSTLRLEPGRFYLFVPAGQWTHMKVWVRSLDGRYYASLYLKVVNAMNGYYGIQYESDHETYLRSLKPADLIVLVRIFSADNKVSVIVPARLEKFDAPHNDAKLFLNSGGTDVTVLRKGSPASPVTCVSPTLRQLMWDTQCILPADLRGEQIFWIVRQYFNHYLPTSEIRLGLP